MSANLIQGRDIATHLKQDIALQIKNHAKAGRRAPELAVVLVGHDPASQIYVSHKQKACEEVGIISHVYALPASTTEEDLVELIHKLNHDPHIDGILVQLPLPAHIQSQLILELIDPMKDVDGFHPYNIGCLVQRNPKLRPCTPKGIMHLIQHTDVDTYGALATVVGASNIVGRPMALELLLAGATVTVCHRFTKDLKKAVSLADILVVAVGQPNLIPGEWVRPDSLVIDVGMNRLEDGRLTGDVEFEAAKARAAWITPVPGGVGPMTIACLLENTLLAQSMRLEIHRR